LESHDKVRYERERRSWEELTGEHVEELFEEGSSVDSAFITESDVANFTT
jgi:hypothetical protein